MQEVKEDRILEVKIEHFDGKWIFCQKYALSWPERTNRSAESYCWQSPIWAYAVHLSI
jgi:hypothetical protein